MSKKIFVIIFSVLMLLQGVAYTIDLSENPLETILLKLPSKSNANWKEILRCVNKNEGVIEIIPLNQTIQNWSELIAIQYFNSSCFDKNIVYSIEAILDHLRKVTLSLYSENQVAWQIIEKNKDNVIYEWILHKRYKNIPPQHEIVRVFLTNVGFHRIGFTRKNEQMSSEEREKWIKLLREHSSVVSFQEAAISPGLSMVEKLKDSISLGPNFLNWKMIDTVTFENGYTSICYIPPTEVGPYVTECLESVTMPKLKPASLDQIFEVEKKCIREKTNERVRFHILEKSSSEVIYSYNHPKDHLQLNAIVRTFLTDHGYYSISYKRGLTGHMQKKEILKWQRKLKSICLKNPMRISEVALKADWELSN